jgi:hypothetical protein
MRLTAWAKRSQTIFVDRAVMGIDQERSSLVVSLSRMTRQVDLLDVGERIGVDIGDRVPLLIGRGDVDIVDVEKEAAPGAPHHLGDEVDLRISAFCEGSGGQRQSNALTVATEGIRSHERAAG